MVALVYNGMNLFQSQVYQKQFVSKPLLSTVSKAYAMTGWRLSYAVGDPEIIAAMSKLTGQTTSNLTSVPQYGYRSLNRTTDSAETMRKV